MALPEVFTIGTNYRLHQVKEWEPDWDTPPMGFLVMWEPPMKGHTYTIGVDPSWGVGKDRAVIHVNRNGTLGSKDMQVAEFTSDTINVHELTPICYMLGNLYKDPIEDLEALMSVECNISDDVVHSLRNNYNYSNLFISKSYDNIKKVMSNKLGWWTTQRTRPKIISKAIHYIKQGWWDINSPWMINELQTIEKLEDKARIEAAAGHHDDIAFAGFIALWTAHDMEFNDFGQVEEIAKRRDRRITTMVDAYNETLPPIEKRTDFINSACSFQDMLDYDFNRKDWDDNREVEPGKR